jgi:hypothetical protein
VLFKLSHSLFHYFFSHLGNLIHDTEAEISSSVEIMKKFRQRIGVPVSNAAVDNAARTVANRALAIYHQVFPDDPIPITTRDPAHCLDLLAKDFGKLKSLKPFLDKLNCVVKLLTDAKIVGICEKGEQQNLVSKFYKVVKKSDTRFYAVADEIKSIVRNKKLLTILPTMPEFEKYMRSRDVARRRTIQAALDVMIPTFWRSAEFLEKLFGVLKHAVTMVSSETTPMSAYLPICFAVEAELNAAVAEVGETEDYELLFGQGSFQELKNCMATRINLDGKPRPGQKMELLDQYQLWCYLVDPFRMYFPLEMKDGDPPVAHFNKALDFYVKETEENKDDRLKISMDFQEIAAMTGKYVFKFQVHGKPLDEPGSDAMPLTLVSVQQWIDKFHGSNGRLTFFSDGYERSLYFKKIALPLLSMKTTGSITVERVAKPLKHGVLDPTRNRLDPMKQIMCLRAGLNLNMKKSLLRIQDQMS